MPTRMMAPTEMLPACTHTAFVEACVAGDLELLRKWKAAAKIPVFEQTKIKASNCELFHEYAIANGHLDVLKWLVFESGIPVDLTAYDNYAVRQAVSESRFTILKWLVDDSGQPVDVTDRDDSALQTAAFYNELDIAKWLVRDSNQCVNIAASDNAALIWAAELGNIAFVDWLLQEAAADTRKNPSWNGRPLPEIDVTARNNEALRTAAGRKRLPVLKKLLFESQQLHRILCADCSWFPQLPEEILVKLTSARVVMDFFWKHGFPDGSVDDYLLSEKSLLLLKSGLFTSLDDFCCVWHADQPSSKPAHSTKL